MFSLKLIKQKRIAYCYIAEYWLCNVDELYLQRRVWSRVLLHPRLTQRDDWNFYSFNVAREVISGVVTVWNKDLSVMCNRVAGVEDVKTSLKFVFVELTHDFREMG